ncbi:isoflavone reductase [Artemisia annua]|uniref:Isoflavone reductase n=1 Tax=Artemisia annua TaxID=35608 RepID=A0A2U1PXP8_ARTAN|nr:isoflavone reductase [Artemisia annua]
MAEKSKILIIGGTGYIGKFIVEASAKAGHPTFILVRETTKHPEKSKLIDNFTSLGAKLLIGDIHDHASLVNAIKQVDVVISTVGGELAADQVKLIAAIKEAGNVKILIIGGTGYIGKFIVEASAKAGHPTFILVRETTKHPEKSKLIDNFTSLGAKLLIGDIHDHASLVNAIKQVDVVISTVGGELAADQVKLIAAIKEAGNVKRFLPSEFGTDVDHVNAIEPAKSMYKGKIAIRRAVEAAKIPHTFVSCNLFAGYFLPTVCQLDIDMAPREKLNIFGDGTPKAVFVKEEDIASVTIKAVDDPRTLNKTLIFRPSGNTVSFNEIVSIWESKIGKTLEKTYVSEEQLVKKIQEAPTFGLSIELALMHFIFINGDLTNFEIEPSFGVEASGLYPEHKFTSVDEYFATLA